jgi:hypothetical protein
VGIQSGSSAGATTTAGAPAPPDNLDKHNVSGGLMAVRTTDLTRESLWTAFTGRRVYATTGARIDLSLTVDETPMGGETTAETPDPTAVVHGTAPLAAVDLFRGPDRVTTRDLTDGADRIELRWTGARSRARDELLDWSGGAALDRGRIVDVEPFGFDHPADGPTRRRPDAVFWDAGTTGDHQGVRLRLDAPAEAQLRVGTDPASTSLRPADIDRGSPRRVSVEGVDARLTVARTGEATDYDVTVSFRDDDPPAGTHPYWVRVRQADGAMAWSSPVFVSVE